MNYDNIYKLYLNFVYVYIYCHQQEIVIENCYHIKKPVTSNRKDPLNCIDNNVYAVNFKERFNLDEKNQYSLRSVGVNAHFYRETFNIMMYKTPKGLE